MKYFWMKRSCGWYGVIGYQPERNDLVILPYSFEIWGGSLKEHNGVRIPDFTWEMPQPQEGNEYIIYDGVEDAEFRNSAFVKKLPQEIIDFLGEVDPDEGFSFAEIEYTKLDTLYREVAWIVEKDLHSRGIMSLDGRVLRPDNVEYYAIPKKIVDRAKELGFTKGFRWNGGDFGAGSYGWVYQNREV